MIPGIVNNFIGLFKDTTLVSIVGMLDFLATVENAFKDTVWNGPTIAPTGYAFAAIVLFRVLLCDVALSGGDGAAAWPGATALMAAMKDDER